MILNSNKQQTLWRTSILFQNILISVVINWINIYQTEISSQHSFSYYSKNNYSLFWDSVLDNMPGVADTSDVELVLDSYAF